MEERLGPRQSGNGHQHDGRRTRGLGRLLQLKVGKQSLEAEWKGLHPDRAALHLQTTPDCRRAGTKLQHDRILAAVQRLCGGGEGTNEQDGLWCTEYREPAQSHISYPRRFRTTPGPGVFTFVALCSLLDNRGHHRSLRRQIQ